MFKSPTLTSTIFLSPVVSWVLPGVVKEPHPVPIPSVGEVKKMSDILGQIQLVLIGLLDGFFFLTHFCPFTLEYMQYIYLSVMFFIPGLHHRAIAFELTESAEEVVFFSK